MTPSTALLVALNVAVVIAVDGPMRRVRAGRRWDDGIVREIAAGAVLFGLIAAWNLLLDALDGTVWAAILIGIVTLYWWARLFRMFTGR